MLLSNTATPDLAVTTTDAAPTSASPASAHSSAVVSSDSTTSRGALPARLRSEPHASFMASIGASSASIVARLEP